MERVESDGKREEENRGRDKGLAKKREKQMKWKGKRESRKKGVKREWKTSNSKGRRVDSEREGRRRLERKKRER